MGVLIRNNIVNQKGTPAFYEDTLTNRPVANLQGRMFVSIDTAAIYRDTGSAWVLIADATGPITGFVPYTGATSNVDLGSFGITANSFTIPSLTTGSVLFAGPSGLISQDNTNLFWDDTNNFLGIGPTGGPTALLDIHSAVQNIFVQLNATSTNNSQLAFLNGGVGKWRIGNLYNAAANDFHIYDTTNSVSRLTIKNTGLGTYTGFFNVANIASAQNIQISGTAPAYTIIDVAGSGYAASLGMATVGNNFIQGSVLGDLCIVSQNTIAGNLKLGVGSTNAAALNISPSNRVQINTSIDASYQLDINGTARVQDNLLINKNQNAATTITLTNITSGTSSQTQFIANSNVGSFVLGKTSTTFTTYKTIVAGDGILYNSSNGDISILNDNASGVIKMASGGSSTAQLTLAANGNLTTSVNQNAITQIIVSNTTSGTLSQAQFNATSNGGNFVLGKTSTTFTTYKTLVANDGILYNTNGDISILNDNVSGKIKFTSGGSSTAQATLFSTGNFSIGSITDVGTAILQLTSTAKGFLPPRMTTAQKNAIGTPATGLVVYDTTLNKLALYTGAAWETVTSI
jgi:hypothetical protein